MRSKMRWRLIGLSLLAACSGGRPADPGSQVSLGPFDSDVIKISWLRLDPVVEEGPGGRRVVRGVQACYSVIFSQGWMRHIGPRPREPWIRNLKMTINEGPGLPDADCRELVAAMITTGLLQVPECDPANLDPREFARIYDESRRDPKTTEWMNMRVIVVETDKVRRVICKRFLPPDPELLQRYGKLEETISYIMGFPRTVRIGVKVGSQYED